jgi:drug/metabolite transporter (DMT)-like permease
LALLWGSGFLLIKVALEGMSPIQIVLGRLVTAAAVMLAVIAVQHQRLPGRLTPWLHLAAMAVITNIAPYFLFAWGEQRITSSLAGVLNATTPLFTLLLAVSTRTERLTLLRLLGLGLGFAGVVVLAAPWHDAGLGGSLPGVGAALLASACYAAGYVYARRFLTGRALPALVLSTGQVLAGSVLLGAAAPVVATGPIMPTLSVLASVLALGVLGTGVAYVLNYRLIEDEGATAASTVTYLLPVVAVALGVVVLGEAATWNLLAGTAIILCGVALSEGHLAKPGPPGPPHRQAIVEHSP